MRIEVTTISRLGTAMCNNGLFAAAAESGNFVIWDLEEKKITYQTPMKNIFQFILHTSDTMVRSIRLFHLVL